jgi:hypothetical protein
MEAVITGFADNIQYDKDGTGQANGQACNIDAVKCLVLADIPYGNPNEIFPHSLDFIFIVPDFHLFNH